MWILSEQFQLNEVFFFLIWGGYIVTSVTDLDL